MSEQPPAAEPSWRECWAFYVAMMNRHWSFNWWLVGAGCALWMALPPFAWELLLLRVLVLLLLVTTMSLVTIQWEKRLLERAKELLEFLKDGPRSLPEIAEHLGISREKAARLVIDCAARGYVSKAGAAS